MGFPAVGRQASRGIRAGSTKSVKKRKHETWTFRLIMAAGVEAIGEDTGGFECAGLFEVGDDSVSQNRARRHGSWTPAMRGRASRPVGRRRGGFEAGRFGFAGSRRVGAARLPVNENRQGKPVTGVATGRVSIRLCVAFGVWAIGLRAWGDSRWRFSAVRLLRRCGGLWRAGF